MEPVVVLREEDKHLPSLLFPGHDLGHVAALDLACAWLERHGLDERGMFTARNEGSAVDRVNRAWWGGFDRGFVQEHHDGAVPVTAVHLPKVAIPMPEDPTVAGHVPTSGSPE